LGSVCPFAVNFCRDGFGGKNITWLLAEELSEETTSLWSGLNKYANGRNQPGGNSFVCSQPGSILYWFARKNETDHEVDQTHRARPKNHPTNMFYLILP